MTDTAGTPPALQVRASQTDLTDPDDVRSLHRKCLTARSWYGIKQHED